MKHERVRLGSPRYPKLLSDIFNPPEQLFIKGNLDILSERPVVAVVGSRKISPYGKQVTAEITEDLARAGVVIASGLALGVDSIAHRAALNAGGLTVAVLPCGIDRVYPRSHTQLAARIIEQGGALISQHHPGVAPQKYFFVARNRIVSGLSLAIIITEASEKSGTLHTVNFALEQGRTVMAVPGNITSPLSHGPNNLIKTGAVPITSANEALQALGLETLSDNQEILAANPHEAAILNLLKKGVSDSKTLLYQSQLDTALFNQTLTMLEISGKIRPLGNGHWGLS